MNFATLRRYGLGLCLGASLLAAGCTTTQDTTRTTSATGNRTTTTTTTTSSSTAPMPSPTVMSSTGAPVASPTAAASSLPAGTIKAHGKVTAIAPDKREVTIAHGDIPEIPMKAMTMPYKVKSPEVLDNVKPDQEIDFFIDNSTGDLVVIQIAPAKP